MKALWSVLSILLALSALVAGQSVFDPSNPGDFRQGAYVILVEAERNLEKGDALAALKKFKIAFMRANRCGRKGVASRIRTRLASAGCDLMTADPAAASKLLAAYSLLSDDFDAAAGKTEDLLLRLTGGRMTRFDYPLIIDGGARTFWLEQPKAAPVFVYSRMDPARELYKLPGQLTYLRAGDLPKDKRFSRSYTILIGSQVKFGEFELSVLSKEKEKITLVVGTNDRKKYHYTIEEPFRVVHGSQDFKFEAVPHYFMLNSLIFFSDSMRKNDVEATLVRKYEQL